MPKHGSPKIVIIVILFLFYLSANGGDQKNFLKDIVKLASAADGGTENALASSLDHPARDQDHGFIVQFEGEPFFPQKKRLEIQLKNHEIGQQELTESLANTNNVIEAQHAKYLRQVLQRVAQRRKIADWQQLREEIAGRQFTQALNGVHLQISPDEAQDLLALPGVKGVFPNKLSEPLLDNSTPLIGARDLWERGITGKGTRIAIIDYGIDYRHVNLGKTPDPMKRILVPDSFNSQHYTIFEGKIFFAKEDGIGVFVLETGQLSTIPLFSGLLTPYRLTVGEDFLAYFARDPTGEIPSGLFVYNFGTKTTRFVDELYSYAEIVIVKDRLFYTKTDWDGFYPFNGNAPYKMWMYNHSDDTLTYIAEDGFDLSAWGNRIAFIERVSDGIPGTTVSIYNWENDTFSVFIDPSIKDCFDLNKDLYFCWSGPRDSFSSDHYGFLNIDTQEWIGLVPVSVPIEETITDNNNYPQQHSLGVSKLEGLGWVGLNPLFSAHSSENLVYFPRLDLSQYPWPFLTTLQLYVFDLENNELGFVSPFRFVHHFEIEDNTFCHYSWVVDQIECSFYEPTVALNFYELILNEKFVGGYDLNYSEPNPIDKHGHGTHVAGVAAGRDETVSNGFGNLDGVAPDAEILAYKVFPYSTDANIIAAMERAVSDGADIINLSLGRQGNPDDILAQAADNVVDAGVVVVASAGNSGPFGSFPFCRNEVTGTINSICVPAAARKVIAVGATFSTDYIGETLWGTTDPLTDMVTGFSSRGPVIWTDDKGETQMLDKPDLVAPGAIICSAFADWGSIFLVSNCGDSGQHILMAGTSMSAPMVSGAAALVKQVHPNWKPKKVKDFLMKNAKDLDLPHGEQGTGRLDLQGLILSDPN